MEESKKLKKLDVDTHSLMYQAPFLCVCFLFLASLRALLVNFLLFSSTSLTIQGIFSVAD